MEDNMEELNEMLMNSEKSFKEILKRLEEIREEVNELRVIFKI